MSGGGGAPGAKLPRLEAPERGDQPPSSPATAATTTTPAQVAVATAAAAAAGETQRALEAVDACQRELEALNERAGEEILRVERKYGELRRPHFERRNRLIEDIPGFWVTAVSFTPAPLTRDRVAPLPRVARLALRRSCPPSALHLSYCSVVASSLHCTSHIAA
ncbi:protein SET-like [Chiloscyllium plagiosum]|uniref:protein SET-like n=1 Tax=Chiloscyllium plagiosum TaxID=36176 RepID=UPI001CB7F7BE|nr:protein SET-like [Chiloscyllium plagiosum]